MGFWRADPGQQFPAGINSDWITSYPVFGRMLINAEHSPAHIHIRRYSSWADFAPAADAEFNARKMG